LTGNAGVSANLFKLVNKDYEVNFVRKDSVVVVPPVKACQV
jgi:hypothetical protein